MSTVTMAHLYERINVWSHLIPSLLFLSYALYTPHMATHIFCGVAALTHGLSAVTHTWPDDYVLDKLDHMGIVALIIATPLTSLLAVDIYPNTPTIIACIALLTALVMPRLMFVGGAATLVILNIQDIFNPYMLAQSILYIIGVSFFARNQGHTRCCGILSDHHILHYTVTAACLIQVKNLCGVASQA